MQQSITAQWYQREYQRLTGSKRATPNPFNLVLKLLFRRVTAKILRNQAALNAAVRSPLASLVRLCTRLLPFCQCLADSIRSESWFSRVWVLRAVQGNLIDWVRIHRTFPFVVKCWEVWCRVWSIRGFGTSKQNEVQEMSFAQPCPDMLCVSSFWGVVVSDC